MPAEAPVTSARGRGVVVMEARYHGATCGGRLRMIELVTQEAAARAELARRGLDASPPPIARARAADLDDYDPGPDYHDSA